MKLLLKKGITSKLLRIFIQDSSVSTGAGKTGLTNANVTAYYIREGDATATSISVVSATVGTFTSGGFKEIDSTNMPGLYEIGIPNAAIATGSNSVVVMYKGTGIAPVVLEIQLVDVDINDATRFGLSALPNAAAEGAGGLFTRGSGAGQINQPGNGLIDVSLKAILNTALTETAGQLAAGFKQFFNIGSPTSTMNTITTVTTATNLTTNNDKTGYALSAAGVQAIWDALTSALTTVGSIGKRLADDIDATISSRSTYAGGDTSGVTTLLGRISAAITITGGKVDVNDKTGFSLSSAGIQAIWDALTSALTTVGSIGKLLVTNIDATISSRLASGSYTTPPTVTQIRTEMDTNSTKLANLDATISSRTKPADTQAAVTNVVNGVTVTTNNDKTGYALTSGERTSIADANLDRDLGAGTDSGGRTVRNALRVSRNKITLVGTTLTVYKEDDTTVAFTAVVTTDVGALPITGVDP